jgi:large subunit ribosomal protein L10
LKKCEALPTKKQLLATIARLVREPAKRIAVGVKMVPTKLAIGIKKISELDEDKTKTCAEVAQPKAEAA